MKGGSMMRSLVAGSAASLALALAACGPADRSQDLLSDVISDQSELSSFSKGLESTGLAGALDGDATYTLLAPSDEAFAALGADGSALLDDPARGAILAAVLREHMLPGALSPDTIRETIEARGGEIYMVSFGNGELSVSLEGEQLVVSNGAGQRAVLGDEAVVSKNGVIIPIDAVLVDAEALSVPAES